MRISCDMMMMSWEQSEAVETEEEEKKNPSKHTFHHIPKVYLRYPLYLPYNSHSTLTIHTHTHIRIRIRIRIRIHICLFVRGQRLSK